MADRTGRTGNQPADPIVVAVAAAERIALLAFGDEAPSQYELLVAIEAAAPVLRAQGAAAERDRWKPLLDEALHLLMYGECAPGGTEMWGVWAEKTEAFLRADLLAGETRHDR